ncbi:DUF6428 family protein [Hirschia maritima]|uniref:DUF6428 family protein n=1 Tax=Hirschia maritima TaxID=1121961 RepID=UPI00037F0E31|nr:DUF6428 family protein [Hirschia maritima]
MTLKKLKDELSSLPPESPVIFYTDTDKIDGNYHVTELKLARIDSIDCVGRRSDREEAFLQLLDGHGGDYMTNAKFSGILEQSINSVKRLGDAPVFAEFGAKNSILSIYHIAEPELQNDQILIHLVSTRSKCRPLEDAICQNSIPKPVIRLDEPFKNNCC